MLDGEGAEAAQLHPLAASERGGDLVEDRCHDRFDVSAEKMWIGRRQLGEEFLRDLQRVLDFVATYPHGCPEVHRGLRRALLHRFPYSVYYRPLELTEIIEVRACLHQSRHPHNWHRRA